MDRWIRKEIEKSGSQFTNVRRQTAKIVNTTDISELIVDLDDLIRVTSEHVYGYGLSIGDNTRQRKVQSRIIKNQIFERYGRGRKSINYTKLRDGLLRDHVNLVLSKIIEYISIIDPRDGLILMSSGALPDGAIWKKRQEAYDYLYAEINEKVNQDGTLIFDPNALIPGTTYMINFFRILGEFLDKVFAPIERSIPLEREINLSVAGIYVQVSPETDPLSTKALFNRNIDENFVRALDRWYDRVAIVIDNAMRIKRVSREKRDELLIRLDGIKDDIFNRVRENELIRFKENVIQRSGVELYELKENFFPPLLIISDHLVPGEVSQKIINYFRFNSINPDRSHLIMSRDQNLLIKALMLDQDHVIVEFNDMYSIDIDALRKMITTRLHKTKKVKRASMNTVSDFVLMTFFLGNRFLRRIPSFQFMDTSLNIMIDKYDNASRLTRSTETGYEIDWNMTSRFLGSLSDDEPELLSELRNQAYRNGFIEISENKSEDGFDYDGFRGSWYEGLSDETIEEISVNQLDMMDWVHRYYQGRMENMGFVYKYDFAPLFYDLYRASSKYQVLIHPIRGLSSVFAQIVAFLPRRTGSSNLTTRKRLMVPDSYELSNTKIGKSIMVKSYQVYESNTLMADSYLKIIKPVDYEYLLEVFEMDKGKEFVHVREITEEEMVEDEEAHLRGKSDSIGGPIEGFVMGNFKPWADRALLL